MENNKNEILVEVKNLKKHFFKNKGIIKKHYEITKAVDDVSFYIKKGETLGLVGESGCGKSTTGRTVLRLYEPTAGQILYNGVDIAGMNREQLMPYRKKMQMIFQDPYASLNARMTVADIIGEPMDIPNLAHAHERQ
ncbi:Oligopeptide transport ATP-binding protein OppF [anaerobic digester metagenome]